MATKTISLEIDAYDKLRAAKKPGESFSEVVRRSSFGPSDTTGRSILKILRERPAAFADKKAVDYWKEGTAKARTSTPSRWERRSGS